MTRNPIRGLAAVAALVVAAGAAHANARSVGYEYRTIASTRVHVVTVNLNDPQVAVSLVLARGSIGRAESFGSMVRRSRPDAAVTGTFFGVSCLLPIGNLVLDGQLLCAPGNGNTVAITWDNQALVIPTRANQSLDWSLYAAALFTGPTLVRNRKYAVSPWAEGFRDPGHYRPARRTAIGVRADNKLLLAAVARPVSLTKMAAIMKALGASDAFALDGGTSSALYYRGSHLVRPGRDLTHIIAVYANGRPAPSKPVARS